MRLKKFRVTNYRSIRDSGWCDVENDKTILVGPNEAGKTALLMALQYLNPPAKHQPLSALRDYPRALYNEINRGVVTLTESVVVTGHFALEASDVQSVPSAQHGAELVVTRYLDGRREVRLQGGVAPLILRDINRDLARMGAHVATVAGNPGFSQQLSAIVDPLDPTATVDSTTASRLNQWLRSVLVHVDESNEQEEARHARLVEELDRVIKLAADLKTLEQRLPTFVLFSNYHRVRPRLHLAHLHARVTSGVLDDDQYDYGNTCLLKFLGFTAKELADLGAVAPPAANNPQALKNYQDRLDERKYKLNAASVQLTREIASAWNPDPKRAEANRLRVDADGQYLKVVVEDDLGVEVELDQRSAGFQWLVSFFVVFFAEAQDQHKNAILLLDEPGLSLHGLKQREFRGVLSRLAEGNQTLFTTHSPFLVGPEELDKVRVVEMPSRELGTKLHTTLTARDSAALLPLQEALGYDLAQSLFAQQRNLVCEGLTDYWYIEATAALLAKQVVLNPKIALVPADGAGKVAYFATILHAHRLKVAALLDSDAAGDQAAKQDALVGTLGNRRILRTKDHYTGPCKTPEIEDLLRDTLIGVARELLDVDVEAEATQQASRPIARVIEAVAERPVKYELAKAYVRWTRDHSASDLSEAERAGWCSLIGAINKALK